MNRELLSSICTELTGLIARFSSDGHAVVLWSPVDVGRPDVDVDREPEVRERLIEGSHSGWPRSGRPPRCGSPAIVTPRRPRSVHPLRLATDASMSQNGNNAIGNRRPSPASCHLGDGVVVDRHDGGGEGSIERLDKRARAEPEGVRVHDLGEDPELVQELESGLGVIGGLVDLLPAHPRRDVDGEGRLLLAGVLTKLTPPALKIGLPWIHHHSSPASLACTWGTSSAYSSGRVTSTGRRARSSASPRRSGAVRQTGPSVMGRHHALLWFLESSLVDLVGHGVACSQASSVTPTDIFETPPTTRSSQLCHSPRRRSGDRQSWTVASTTRPTA